MWYHEPMIHIIQFHIIQFTVTKDDDLTHTSGLFGLIPSFLRTKDRSGDKSPQRFDHHPNLKSLSTPSSSSMRQQRCSMPQV
jgi:hypothetical protein